MIPPPPAFSSLYAAAGATISGHCLKTQNFVFNLLDLASVGLFLTLQEFMKGIEASRYSIIADPSFKFQKHERKIPTV
ncbi:hypothetical protein COLO4_06899 [Corchorus olitorius]|uniref:Uncharacterized protein n=1 Tax=Corchorus olitorius TaxID=93759 RepID=A0A1R3KLJ9_9ROSI|nr:hypothetical protein COLO4_06899 [Corchorus olitorius]